MARRRTRRKTRRRQPKAMFNLLNLAQAGLLGNAVTTGFFGMPIGSFITEGWLTPATKKGGSGLGGWGSGHSGRISAAELFGGLFGGTFGVGPTATHTSVGSAIRSNLTFQPTGDMTNQGAKMIVSLIAIPAAFKIAKRVLGRPLINPLNRGLKNVGLASTVKV